MGTASTSRSRGATACPIVVTGFEPLDVLDGIRRAVRQLEDGRAEVENAYPRAVRREGNAGRAGAAGRGLRAYATGSWRGIGTIADSGWRLARRVPGVRRRASASASATDRAARAVACRAGDVLQGLIKPDECPAFGPTARRGTRWARRWCRPRAPAPAVPPVPAGSSTPADRSTPWLEAGPARCRSAITTGSTLGHGGGGVAHRRTGRARDPARLRRGRRRRHGRRRRPGPAAPTHPRSRQDPITLISICQFASRRATWCDRCSSPAATSGRWPSTARSTIWPWRARNRWRCRPGSCSRRGSSCDVLQRVAASMGAAADGGRCRDRGGRHQGGRRRAMADGMYITTAGVGVVPPASTCGPRRAAPGDAIIVSGDIGVHGITVISLREGLEFGTELGVGQRRRSTDWWRPMLDACADVHVLRDLTRGGLAAACARSPRPPASASSFEERAAARAGAGRGGVRLPGPRPDPRGQRGQARGHRPGRPLPTR